MSINNIKPENRLMRSVLFILSVFLFATDAFSQNSQGFFIGQELLELGDNRSGNYAFETGYGFDKNQIRLVMMDVILSEEHLSGSRAQIVDGDNVKGRFKGQELNYERFFTATLYYMANVSAVEFEFECVDTGEKTYFRSNGIGSGIGVKYRGIFGIDSLYLNFSVPIRILTHPFKETEACGATIRGTTIAPNFWFFIGFDFY